MHPPLHPAPPSPVPPLCPSIPSPLRELPSPFPTLTSVHSYPSSTQPPTLPFPPTPATPPSQPTMPFAKAAPPQAYQTPVVDVLQPPLITLTPLQHNQSPPTHNVPTSVHQPISTPNNVPQQTVQRPHSPPLSFHRANPQFVQPVQNAVVVPPQLPSSPPIRPSVDPVHMVHHPPLQRPGPMLTHHPSPYQQRPSYNSLPLERTNYAIPFNAFTPSLSRANSYPQHAQMQPVVTAKPHQLTPTKTNPVPASPLNVTSPPDQLQGPVSNILFPSTKRDAAAVQYWNRLQDLLTSARSFALELQPNQTGLLRPSETPRQIAYDLQGLTASGAQAKLANQSEQYKAAYKARAAGDFIEYGVASAHAVWAAHVLSAVVGTEPPAASIPDAPQEGTCPDKAVEDVRLRVFEAEVSCLPVEFVEALLKRRRSMRKFKNRIDLCVRILLALEGRGRRPTQASLDRWKLQLEKADIQARAEADREAARKERERQKHERLKKNVVKAEDSKKRRRQQSAQANFMKRFVRKDEKDAAEDEELVVVETARRGFAAPLAKERDVMSVSWWLRAEMPGTSLEKLDDLFRGQNESEMSLAQLVHHMGECAKRREVSERRIHVVLREYRQQRKMHTENRTPMFTSRRSDVRGRGVTGPVKLLQFDENYRPAYFGTFSRRSRSVSGRRPFRKDSELDYECDSADEWDEDEEGEDLLDVEADKELASEEAELRRLYGSDDEDDDDFLDDGDVEEEDDEDGNGPEDEADAGSGQASQGVSSPSKGNDGGVAMIDLTLATVNEAKGELCQKRSAKDDYRKRSGKRRKGILKQSVVIHDVSIPDGEPSPLDRFAVNAFEGSQPIQMFNPFVYTSSDIVAEHLKAKPPSLRATRASSMDESTKLDLAATLMRTGSTKDKIILQFCEHRKMRGLAVPTKAEIMRAIAEIATKEKREGDTRASWHLTDQSMARKVALMNSPAATALSRTSPSVIVD